MILLGEMSPLSLSLLFLSVVIELFILVEDSKQKLASPERHEQCHFECWTDYNYCIPTYYNFSTSYSQPLHETYVIVGVPNYVPIARPSDEESLIGFLISDADSYVIP